MEIASNGNDTDVVVINTERTQELHVGTVTDLCIGYDVHSIVNTVFVVIHSHYLMPKLIELQSNVLSEISKSDK